jgi:hypothetical protein
MVAVHAIFDGKEFRPVSAEVFPEIKKEVPVAIVFLDETVAATPPKTLKEEAAKESLLEIFLRMRTARDAMPPLGMSIPEMIEEGRER